MKKKKKSSSRPFLAHPAATQETTFYLRVALYLLIIPTERQPVHSLHLVLPQFVVVLVDSRLLVLFPITRFGTILELKKQVFMFNAVLYIF